MGWCGCRCGCGCGCGCGMDWVGFGVCVAWVVGYGLWVVGCGCGLGWHRFLWVGLGVVLGLWVWQGWGGCQW